MNSNRMKSKESSWPPLIRRTHSYCLIIYYTFASKLLVYIVCLLLQIVNRAEGLREGHWAVLVAESFLQLQSFTARSMMYCSSSIQEVNFEMLQLAVEFDALHFRVESQSVFLCCSEASVVLCWLLIMKDCSLMSFSSVLGAHSDRLLLETFKIFLIWDMASMKLCKDCCCLRRSATFSAVLVLTARHWMTVEVFSKDCICESTSESSPFCSKDSNARWSEPTSSGLALEQAEAYADYYNALSMAVSLWLCVVDSNIEAPLASSSSGSI